MNTNKGLNLKGFLTASNPMAKFSDYPWSEAAYNNNQGSGAPAYLTANQLNLMSRFSLNSTLALHSAAESDATSSSASSISANNNNNTSSNSLSVSPTAERDTRPLSIKSPHQASNHLLELQKEIKEEEEEIFADINSLINSRSNLYSAFEVDDDDDGVNLDDDENQASFSHNLARHQQSATNNVYHPLSDFRARTGERHHDILVSDSEGFNAYHSYSADDIKTCDYQNESVVGLVEDNESLHQLADHQFKVDDSETRNEFVSSQDEGLYLPEPTEEGLNDQADHENDPQYVEDDDEAFAAACNQADEQPNYEALQAVIQQVTSNLPKPCVFFLEGNCRRSDCKYSHDLSNITCKYWIEGFCFKGEMCPFLHSYTPAIDSQDPSLLDEDGLKALSKKELNPTFVIESEADFPSLPLDAPVSALSDSIKSSINTDAMTTTIKNQILSSNPAVVFKTIKKKRKRG